MIILADLPINHPLRSTPLGEIEAECRNRTHSTWRPVKRWKIATATYNELGSAWTETSEFRCAEVF